YSEKRDKTGIRLWHVVPNGPHVGFPELELDFRKLRHVDNLFQVNRRRPGVVAAEPLPQLFQQGPEFTAHKTPALGWVQIGETVYPMNRVDREVEEEARTPPRNAFI